MQRREFLGVFAGATAWPMLARAQQSARPVIGFLNPNSADAYPAALSAFRAGLAELGFIENQNVTILYGWANGHNERLTALAADFASRRVNVIAATGGGAAAFAAKSVTSTIPIVFNSAADPVKSGLVNNLREPSGNLTGVSRLTVDLIPKRLELLREVAPSATVLAYLVDPGSVLGEPGSAEEITRRFSVELQTIQARAGEPLMATFSRIIGAGANALLIGGSAYFNSRSADLGRLSAEHKLPAIYQSREFAQAGGLMSYGAPLADAYHTVGVYTGRILKGAQPADLPVQLQSKVEFILNLRAAKALDLKIPLPLLGRADEVIE